MLSRIIKRIRKLNVSKVFLILIVICLIYLAWEKYPPPESIYQKIGLIYFFVGGLFLVVCGELIRIWATGHLEKNKSLTTSGPYGYVKNPMYAGSFMIMLGFNALAVNTYTHYILLLQLLLFLFYYVPRKKKIESARLLEKFGLAYADYDKNVPDYIPRKLTPYQGINSDKRWSMAVFKENNELEVAFSVLLGVIALSLRFWIN